MTSRQSTERIGREPTVSFSNIDPVNALIVWRLWPKIFAGLATPPLDYRAQ
jgi:hypothetical protein